MAVVCGGAADADMVFPEKSNHPFSSSFILAGMTRQPLASLGHRIVHALAICGGWFIYFWLWWRVIYVYGQGLSPLVALFLVGAIIVVPTITVIWILHNVRIYKRKGMRQHRTTVDDNYDADWKGRHVTADWTGMKQASSIVISVSGNDKQYEAA